MFLLYFVIIFGITPLFYYFIACSKNTTELKPIIPFITLTFISSLYELFGSLIFGWDVSNWYIFYSILSFFCIYYFYFSILHSSYLKLNIFFLISFLVLVYFLFQRYTFEDFFIIDSYIKVYTTLIILVFSILWFTKLFTESYIDNLLRNCTFYFISGFVLYYCGTLFLFLLSNFFYKINIHSLQSYWFLNILLNFVLRTLLVVGLWMVRTR